MAGKFPSQFGTLLRAHGFSLIEVMVAVTITVIAAGAMASLMYESNRQIAILQQKTEIQDFRQSLLTNYILRAGVCSCQFNLAGMTFDSGVTDGSQFIDVGQLRNGCGAGPTLARPGLPLPGTTTGLEVSTIRVANFVPTGAANIWQGDIQVSFKSESLKMNLKPAQVSHTFQVDVSVPANAKIVACANESVITGGVLNHPLGRQLPGFPVLCGYAPNTPATVVVGGITGNYGNGDAYTISANVNGVAANLYIENHPDGTAPVTLTVRATANVAGCFTVLSWQRMKVTSLAVYP